MAYDPVKRRQVAIKQIPIDPTAAKEVAKVQKEIEIMRELKHPNIVRYLGTHSSRQELYIVMEYVRGGSISEYLELRGKLGLPVRQARCYMIDD